MRADPRWSHEYVSEFAKQATKPRKIDAELTKYDLFNRSPDDAESYRVRYGILKKRFEKATAKTQ